VDDAARAIQTHHTDVQFSQRNTTPTGCLGTSKATGFQVTLQCHKSGGRGTKKEQVIITQSRITLCACLEELRSRIEERHGGDCVKAVQAFNSAQETSTAAEGLLASSAPHVMMRLKDATLRAAAAAGATRARVCTAEGMVACAWPMVWYGGDPGGARLCTL